MHDLYIFISKPLFRYVICTRMYEFYCSITVCASCYSYVTSWLTKSLAIRLSFPQPDQAQNKGTTNYEFLQSTNNAEDISMSCQTFATVYRHWYIIHYYDVLMGAMASKSPASRLFTQPFIQTQIRANIKAPRHWPLCGEFTGDRWIPRTNG